MTYIISLATRHNLSIALFQESQPGGNISGWVWLIIILLIIFVVAWAMISNRKREEFPLSEHAEQAHPTETQATSASVEVPAATPAGPPPMADDLAIIEGIGPKISSVLQVNGVATFAQLASTQTSELQRILQEEGLRLADPTTWPEQARLAATGDWDGLNALQARLKGGRQV
jgi:predicted flap endonuclease-1-like 5' DNA nuclease